MAIRTIDPEQEGIHPLRLTLRDEDWDRLDRIVRLDSTEACTEQELAAYHDAVYDHVVSLTQTHSGTTVLQ